VINLNTVQHLQMNDWFAFSRLPSIQIFDLILHNFDVITIDVVFLMLTIRYILFTYSMLSLIWCTMFKLLFLWTDFAALGWLLLCSWWMLLFYCVDV